MMHLPMPPLFQHSPAWIIHTTLSRVVCSFQWMNSCNRNIISIAPFLKQFLSHLVPTKLNTNRLFHIESNQKKGDLKPKWVSEEETHINEGIIAEQSVKKEGDAHQEGGKW